MRFFEHQDQARSRTSLLVSLFAIAVIGIGGIAGAVTHLLLTFGRRPEEPLSDNYWPLVLGVPLGVWAVILLVSAFRLLQLRGGGGARVAEQLGGTLLGTPTHDLLERRLLNVVEEMSIASGLPVPPVYLLRTERGINAFAAGWSQDDAVLGVTQGALEGLSRDQLQGVIAHEFSHVLNRDSALNMRLLGVLHGIVAIATIGRVLIHLGTGSGHRSRTRSDGAPQLVMLGAAIWLFGSLGALIARIIQAAVSQQREYLADASAVQFTRNPRGIAGALATIGSQSSRMDSPASRDASHMLISSPGALNFGGLASHPPLFERIVRVLPGWDGDFAALATEPGSQRRLVERTGDPGSGAEDPSVEGWILEAVTHPIGMSGTGAAVAAQTVPTDARSSALAPPSGGATLLSQIPPILHRAAEEPYSARALILAWILDHDDDARAAQLMLLGRDAALAHETERLAHQLPLDDPRLRLPLFDIALGTLAQLSKQQKREFAHLVEELAAQLGQRSFVSFCLANLTLRHLRFTPPRKRPSKMLVKTAFETALGVLAQEGHDDDLEAEAAFVAGRAKLGPRGHQLVRPPASELGVHQLRVALHVLVALPLSSRRRLLEAAEVTATYDANLRPEEEQLLRTLSVCLDVARHPLEQ